MSEPKRGPGRPPGVVRSAHLHIKTLPATLERWRAAAELEGVSLTAWIEQHLERAANRSKGGKS